MKLLRLSQRVSDFEQQFSELCARKVKTAPEVAEQVSQITQAVAEYGDSALLEYTCRFDGHNPPSVSALEILSPDMESACNGLASDLREALMYAAARIKHYHEKQLTHSWSYEDEFGIFLGQKITPIDRVGVYVPGGKAAYPTSVLMNVIPAVVAGVPEIVMVVPAPEGVLNQTVLAAAHIAGVTRAFSVGGAQAVAALAYGTETVPKVDKVVGPGNAYVAEAKRVVFGVVGIDMIAGPSEILIVADDSANPDWLAMDMFAQAEHDEAASAILVSPSAALLDAVSLSMKELLPNMTRQNIIARALEDNSLLIEAKDIQGAVEIANRIAPEHLQLCLADTKTIVEQIRHAGAIFIGHYSAEVFGDYCAGPNHVLPTTGGARFSSPLGVYDFQKRSSLIECNRQSAKKLVTPSALLAREEGLDAHARSAEYRDDE